MDVHSIYMFARLRKNQGIVLVRTRRNYSKAGGVELEHVESLRYGRCRFVSNRDYFEVKAFKHSEHYILVHASNNFFYLLGFAKRHLMTGE